MIYFCHVIVKFTASLESPYFWDTYSFEGVAPGIRRVTPDDVPRETVSQGGDEHWALLLGFHPDDDSS